MLVTVPGRLQKDEKEIHAVRSFRFSACATGNTNG